MSPKYFYSAVFGFCAGTALLLLGIPLLVVVGLSGLVSFSFLVIRLYVRGNGLLFCVVLFLIAASVGALRVDITDNPQEASAFDTVLETPITAQATVVSRPSGGVNSQQFTARLDSVMPRSASTTVSGPAKAIVYGPMYPALSYGDKISISGQIQKPKVFSGSDGRSFPYPQYLARKNIYYEINRPEITRIGSGGGSTVRRWLAQLQNKLLAVMQRLIPEPESSLAGGVLLGAEEKIGQDLIADFRTTSVVHVVVLSGFHITVVTAAIGKGLIFAGVPLAGAMLAAGIGILLFVLLVGISPTIIRASIMAVFALIARVSGRQYAAGRGLGLAAIGMILMSPKILLYDPSFQLSVAATAGLIMFGDHVNDRLAVIPQWWGLREIATATVSAQLMVLPLILYHMGTLSLVSLPTNLLVLPVIPILMAAAAVTVIVGVISLSVGFIPAILTYALAGYVIVVVQWFARIPGAAVSVPQFPVWVVFVLYMIIAALYYYLECNFPSETSMRPTKS